MEILGLFDIIAGEYTCTITTLAHIVVDFCPHSNSTSFQCIKTCVVLAVQLICDSVYAESKIQLIKYVYGAIG